MMLTIHGLPLHVKYKDLKEIINDLCHIDDLILDNLVNDNEPNKKKVRVGVANDEEGNVLMRSLDGYRLEGHVLRVVPVGKPPQQNQQQHQNFNQYGNNVAPAYNNAPAQNYGGHRDAAPAPSYGGMGGQRDTPQSYGGAGGHRDPAPAQWSQEAQWTSNPVPAQGSYGYQGQTTGYGQQQPLPQQSKPQYPREAYTGAPAPQAGYGQYPTNVDPAANPNSRGPAGRSHVLRNIEIMDTPIEPARPYAAPAEKPITIAKDTFQGPPAYRAQDPPSHYGRDPPKPQPWANSQAPYQSESKPYQEEKSADVKGGILRMPEGFRPNEKPFFSAKDRLMDIMGRGPEKRDFRDARDEFNKMDERRPVETKREFDPEPKRAEFKLGIRNDLFNPDFGVKKEEFARKEPFGGDRRGDSFGRRDEMQRDVGRDNDGGRRMSPGRRISPRRVSPSRQPSPGRRMSPGRRPSPHRRSPGRKLSPGRKVSPGRRLSPGRKVSPGRRMSPVRRASPRRSPQRYSPSRLYDKPEFEPQTTVKQVRPAYEPAPAPSQYSGGYRGSVTENVQYPVPKRSSPWIEGNGNSYKKPEDDRREFARPFNRPIETKRSRSPVRRDRSPLGFRAKRHSPSPRSPRRSWANEKRNSPDILDAPPPPAWHGKSEPSFSRPKIPERFEKEDKRPVVWEQRADKPDLHSTRFDDYRGKEGPSRSDHRREDTSDVWKSREVPKYRPEDDMKRREEIRSKEFDREAFRRRDDKEDRDSFFKRTVDRKEYGPKDRKDDLRRPDDYRKEDFRKPEFKDTRRHNSPPRFKEHSPQRFQDRSNLPFLAREQRDRAVEKIVDRICNKHKVTDSKVYDELKVTLSMKIFTNFGTRNVQTNDILEWFVQRYNEAEQDEMFADVVESLPKTRPVKRPGEATSVQQPDAKAQKTDVALKTQKELVKEKFKMAIDQIRRRIVKEQGIKPSGEHFKRILEELNMVLLKILLKFGEKFGPSCDVYKKYSLAYKKIDEEKMMDDVFEKIGIKRPLAEMPQNSEKMARPALANVNSQGAPMEPQTSRWDVTAPPGLVTGFPVAPQIIPGNVMLPQTLPLHGLPPVAYHGGPMMELPQFNNQQQAAEMLLNAEEDSYNLYLCKDDFDIITCKEAEALKNFLVAQIFEANAKFGWAPAFTLKGLQSLHRYEVGTADEQSRNWLMHLDFSMLKSFNVLVYTKEELWYERAAIWLPGHSKCRKLEPLQKLEMQNRHIEGINISKWKLVKKLIMHMGTRIYVDMPPSSARVLEKSKMMLSYELQKVNVFLKAIAVDKDAFDAGLKGVSISEAELKNAHTAVPMPVLSYDPKMVKMCLKGNKLISPEQAKGIKESVIFKLFSYLKDPLVKLRTDFLKFGFSSPGYFVILPENDDSRKWLVRLHDIGKLNKHEIVVMSDDASTCKYFKMKLIFNMTLPPVKDINSTDYKSNILIMLRASNYGIKGLDFHKWQVGNIFPIGRYKERSQLNVDIDLDSVLALRNINFTLDYRDKSVKVEHNYWNLDALIEKYKSEGQDSYDVANMELESDSEDDRDRDDDRRRSDRDGERGRRMSDRDRHVERRRRNSDSSYPSSDEVQLAGKDSEVIVLE